jgi:uncharacterized protein YlxP (DUF503 family)
MIVAAARIILHIPENASLKGKRQVVRSLIEKVRHRFGVAIAEVDGQELWQRAEIGLAVVGNDEKLLSKRVDQVLHFMENQHLAEIIDSHLELVHLEK